MAKRESSSSPVVRQIDKQFLVCSICLDRYHNPKVLPCLHTFCERPPSSPRRVWPPCRTTSSSPTSWKCSRDSQRPVAARMPPPCWTRSALCQG
uniref:Zinc finger RING-type eukaryotic domain-containing protein n=1 Tax=Sphenodon punctatus TaxID=8508 RepID=A0A8D0HBV4_SPHPU